MNEDLKQNIERMEAELAEMKAKLEKRKNWPENLVKGMVFRHRSGYYMTRAKETAGNDLDLVQIAKHPEKPFGGTYGNCGNAWSMGRMFGGNEADFAYVGMASEVIKIEDPTL